MVLIKIMLAVSALYCAGMYAWVYVYGIRKGRSLTAAQMASIEANTFHLGICFILAIGFLGLLLGH
jgi:hypothetical protein